MIQPPNSFWYTLLFDPHVPNAQPLHMFDPHVHEAHSGNYVPVAKRLGSFTGSQSQHPAATLTNRLQSSNDHVTVLPCQLVQLLPL